MKVSKDIRNIALLSLILIIVWILVELYGLSSETTAVEAYEELLRPIDPKINHELLDSLSERLTY